MKHSIKDKRNLSRLFIALSALFALCLVLAGARAGSAADASQDGADSVRDDRVREGDPSLIKIEGKPWGMLALSPAQWFQARVLPDSQNAGSKFGWSVAISGNTALVGAYLQRVGNAQTGAVYVFERQGANWNLQATLTPEGETMVSNFGISVALSGDIAVIGRTGNNFIPSGAFYVFQRNGATWSQRAKIERESRYFGGSVAIDGETIVVGDELATVPNAYQSGTAYAYRFNGTTWALESQLTGSAQQAFDHFGISVAVSGETIIVGSYADDTPGGLDAGSAYIFQRNGNAWNEQAYLVAPDTAAGDYAGWSVDIIGDMAAVGAYNDDFSGITNAGSVTIWQRSGTTWTRQTKLNAFEAQTGGTFGYSVSLSGNTLMVGAQLNDSPPVQNAGAAYIFERRNGAWDNGDIVLQDSPALNDAFGTSVSLSDNTFIVGIPNSDITPVINLGSSQIYIHRPAHRGIGDFDGDTQTDLSVFRPSDGHWYARRSLDGAMVAQQFAASGDRPVPGDYDGDGRTDIAVFRPSNGTWYILHSSNNVLRARQFGLSTDTPVPGDYDGDALTDIAVFRPSDGSWYIYLASSNTVRAQVFGTSGDRSVQGDYDGDGRTDLAVFRPSTNNWYILQSMNSMVRAEQWGDAGDVAVPGDYDGDAKRDIAVYRPATGGWYVRLSTLGMFRGQVWGTMGDTPVPGDYNADGRTDFAVFRPAEGVWYILQSGSNALRVEQWGVAGDVPVPSMLNQ